MTATEFGTRTGRYLTFDLDGERFGVDAMRVAAIIGNQPCTPLPRAPAYVKGLTMVRGKVVPVIYTRVRLGMTPTGDGGSSCIVLLIVGNSQTGVCVDVVHTVIDIDEGQFDDPCGGIDYDGMTGIAKLKDTIVSVLDADEITSLT